jgi:hypothetical protein
LTATLINFTIWPWKLKKLIPSIASVTNEVDFLFECAADASKRIENLAINPHKNGLFVAPMQNGLKYGVSLQCLLSS